jgi:membrane fusion protein (multidrug efflux system)
MWVYFNVPEARYLDYKARLEAGETGLDVSLKLANGEIFPEPGEIGAIEADFNNETGNIAFRADFPNPKGLLRYGQTGTILIHRTLEDAIVIPQRATYEILAKKYVWVVEPVGKGGSKHAKHEEHEEHEGSAKKGEHGAGHHESAPGKEVGVVRQREIVIQDELDDLYVIKKGLEVGDKIVFEGVQQVRDGDEVDYVMKAPQEILSHLKYHAE